MQTLVGWITIRRAAEWVRQNLTGGTAGAPEITEGEAFIHFSR